jgi:hypothetical protein
MSTIIEEVQGMYKIIKLNPFRSTQGVNFDMFPLDMISHIDSIDRVIHKNNAVSPGPAAGVERPWYMHKYQDDNLLVLHGMREIDIYTKDFGKIEHFTVTPEKIYKNGKLIYEGSAVLVWSKGVFHRIESGNEGSASLNIAVHYDGFDINHNFDIYDLNTVTGDYKVIRSGFEDQFS